MNRREFARLLTLGGAAPFLTPGFEWPRISALPAPPPKLDESYWQTVRDQFVMPNDLAVLNAANLCPSSGPVLETLYRTTKDMDRDPSFDNRVKLGDGREATRKALADFLRVTPEEIVITRNTMASTQSQFVASALPPSTRCHSACHWSMIQEIAQYRGSSRRTSLLQLAHFVGGTGSYPPGWNGWQRSSRQSVSRRPRHAPWVASASRAYALQDG